MNAPRSFPLTETSRAAGHAGACGCGVPVDDAPELDVRVIPHAIRHATVLGAWSAIPHGGSLVLVAPHDPKRLLAQLFDQGPVSVTYLDEGPDAWRLQLTRG